MASVIIISWSDNPGMFVDDFTSVAKRNNNLTWMTKSLRRMVRRKERLHRPTRKSKQWTEYKQT
jgi:hypothetical protein